MRIDSIVLSQLFDSIVDTLIVLLVGGVRRKSTAAAVVWWRLYMSECCGVCWVCGGVRVVMRWRGLRGIVCVGAGVMVS